MVGARGFEPPAHCSQSSCATRLRYAPTISCELQGLSFTQSLTGLQANLSNLLVKSYFLLKYPLFVPFRH